PTATITMPASAITTIRSLPTISGTLFDNFLSSSVSVAIQRQDGLWFSGINFNVSQSTPNFLPADYLSPGATFWSYSAAGILGGKMAGGFQYTIVVQGTDAAGNVQSIYAGGVSSMTVKIDQTAPTAGIDVPPAPSGSYKPVDIGEPGTLLHGTASDAGVLPSGINNVQVRLSYLVGGDTYYWDGGQFSSSTVNASTAWQGASYLTGNWTYTTSIVWPTDVSHLMKLEAQAFDNATLGDGSGGGNPSAIAATSFNVDFVAPAGAITLPAANAFVNSLPLITGTASDDLAGVSNVNVEISSGAGTRSYWTGSGWSGSQGWNAATLYTSSWTYASPTWATGIQF